MAMNEKMRKLFFNYPTKQWHFEDLLVASGLSRSQNNEWIKKLLQEGLINRIKRRGKMPYYIADYSSSRYLSAKKIFVLEEFRKSGFLEHLLSLKGAKAVIIFGSIIRGDWHKDSDIDLFVYGEADNLELGKYWLKLGREIQFFGCRDGADLRKYDSALLKNVVSGYTVKGRIPGLEVRAVA